MIVNTTGWHQLRLSDHQLQEIVSDAFLSVDHIFQEGEVKLLLDSTKFWQDGKITQLPDNETTSYCIQITKIISVEVSCGNNSELRVSRIEQFPRGLRIVGRNGEFNFSGHSLAFNVLMDNKSNWSVDALNNKSI